MNVYVRCERCKRETSPLILHASGIQQQMALNCRAGYEINAPDHWQELDGHLLCPDCVGSVRAAIVATLGKSP